MSKFKLLLVFGLIAVVGICSFFYYFGHHDDQALADFASAYQNYDQAISSFSKSVIAPAPEGASAKDDFKQKADEALFGLNTKASTRISSLTRNDAELMKVMLEIASISGKEFNVLQAYQRSVADPNPDLDQLTKELADWTKQRRTAYARFQELSGVKE